MKVLTVAAVLALCGACRFADGPAEVTSVFEDEAIPRWDLADAPQWAVGGADERDGYLLHGVRGVVIMENRVLIADGGTQEIRFFDLDGALLTRFGRRGSGPGEFQWIGGVARVDEETVAVWDRQLARLTFIRVDGALIGTTTPDLSSARNLSPGFVGILPGGRAVFRDEQPESSLRGVPVGERRDSIDLLMVERDGTWSGIQHRVRGPEVQVWRESMESSVAWGALGVLFGRSTLSTVAGDDLVVAFNDSLDFMRIESGVRPTPHAALPWDPRRVSARDVESERERRLEEVREQAARSNSANTINGVPIAERMLPPKERAVRALAHRESEPAFSDMLGDFWGRIWVAEFRKRRESEARWVVLDSDFAPVGRLEVPVSFEVLAVGPAAIVVLSTDDLGRQSVALYRVETTETSMN